MLLFILAQAVIGIGQHKKGICQSQVSAHRLFPNTVMPLRIFPALLPAQQSHTAPGCRIPFFGELSLAQAVIVFCPGCCLSFIEFSIMMDRHVTGHDLYAEG